MDVKTAKKMLRWEIWTRVDTSGIAKFPLPCYGRIPNFAGSEKAAERIRLLKEWKEARVIFANPDYAQQKVREYALLDGKMLVMASTRLKQGYILVDSKDVKSSDNFAPTIRGIFEYGRAVNDSEIPKSDLIVEGSVAVDVQGHKLGKGHGYGDVEIGTLKRLFGNVTVATTVHDIQVVENVPFEENDEKVSTIVTPTRIIRVSP